MLELLCVSKVVPKAWFEMIIFNKCENVFIKMRRALIDTGGNNENWHINYA